MNTIARALFLSLALSCCIPMARGQTPANTGAPDSEQPALATPQLIREIQFMLLNLSIDPGPIDGNAQQFTNRAVRIFEERNGLPQVDLANGRPVPPDFLAKLRGRAKFAEGRHEASGSTDGCSASGAPQNRGTSASGAAGDSPTQTGASSA